SVAIAGFPSGAYLAGGLENGVRVTISSIRKFPSNAMPAAGKACGQYINSVRAVQEAQRKGYDEAILLNQRGEVSEGSGENIFLVKNGGVVTNDIDADILMGVTRPAARVPQMARVCESAGRAGVTRVSASPARTRESPGRRRPPHAASLHEKRNRRQ